jgi:hypothetical protein
MLRVVVIFSLLVFTNLLLARPVKILFIGNGLTSYNGVPWEFRDLAESAGNDVIVDAYTQDSYALSFHNGLLGDMNAIEKINSQTWDYVILQEQSLLPVIPEMTRAFTIPAIRDLSNIAKQKNKCARIILFMTWARPTGGSYCVQIDSLGLSCSPRFFDFFHMQDSVESSYLRIVETVQAEIAPIGNAWKRFLEQVPGKPLFFGNTNLANDLGAYLSACVLYSTIFQRELGRINYISTLSSEDARLAQQYAELTVMPDRQKWHIKMIEYQPQPFFEYMSVHNQVQFIDKSINGYAWSWDFGDGSISKETNPFHKYPEFGTYEVCLKLASPDKCPRIYCKELILSELFILYPNPCSDYLTLELLQEISESLLMECVSIKGNIVFRKKFSPPVSGLIKIEMSGIPSGSYLIRFSLSGITISEKIIVLAL